MEQMNIHLDYKPGNDKKKILFLIPSLRIGGAERVCCNICDNLDFTRYEIYLISLSDQIPLANTLKNKSKIKILTCKEPSPNKFPWVSFKSFQLFRKHTKEIKPDIVHSHLWGINSAYIYSFLFHSKKPIFVATIHSSGFIYNSKKTTYKIFRFIENSIYRFLKFNLVSISAAVENMVQNKLYYKTLTRISNGIDTSQIIESQTIIELKKGLALESAYPIIIHIGRASNEKRQEDIIKAMPYILVKYPRTKLLLVGRDITIMYSDLVKSLRITNSVLLLNERDDVSYLLRISDIGVFPSLYEGLPLALIEMMAAGLPLVVSDIPILKDLTRSGLAAIYVPIKSPEEINLAVDKILTENDLMKSISANAKMIADENYSLKNMVKKYEELYYCLTLQTHYNSFY